MQSVYNQKFNIPISIVYSTYQSRIKSTNRDVTTVFNTRSDGSDIK